MASEILASAKVTSSGSQYSVSASDDVTVPNPTPLTEALETEVIDPPPEIDFRAMTKTLATIAEALNESAEEAMYPTPPINTPAVTPPASSVVHQLYKSRSRGLSGMSTFGDRLAQAVSAHRNFRQDSDIMSTSCQSLHSSIPADDESDSTSDLLSNGGRARQDIPIALGSPRVNPMGLISFTSNDLADRPPVPFNSTDIIESARPVGVSSGSMHPQSAKSAATGVTEMSNWGDDVIGSLEHALLRLENLARDEYNSDPSKPMAQYYEAHLKLLLGAHERKFPVSVDLTEK